MYYIDIKSNLEGEVNGSPLCKPLHFNEHWIPEVFPIHQCEDHTHTHTLIHILSSAYCVPARVLRLGFSDNRSHPLKVCEKQPKHPIYMHSSPWLICRPLILYVCPGNRGAPRTNIYCCSQNPNESRLVGALSEMGLSCCSFLSWIPSFTFT